MAHLIFFFLPVVSLIVKDQFFRLYRKSNVQVTLEPLISQTTGGGKRVRTADPLLAKQVLFQLSYTPKPI
jgi:hypothetical protein